MSHSRTNGQKHHTHAHARQITQAHARLSGKSEGHRCSTRPTTVSVPFEAMRAAASHRFFLIRVLSRNVLAFVILHTCVCGNNSAVIQLGPCSRTHLKSWPPSTLFGRPPELWRRCMSPRVTTPTGADSFRSCFIPGCFFSLLKPEFDRATH